MQTTESTNTPPLHYSVGDHADPTGMTNRRPGSRALRLGRGIAPALAAVLLASVARCPAAVFQEDFSSDPAARGWRVSGEPALFHWNPSEQNLAVTWNSSLANSYFAWPLGTIVSRADDFQFAFDLRLSHIAVGTTPDKPFTFELAIGLINLSEAAGANFLRGTGTDSPDLVEFDYFPDTVPPSGFGATISPTIISSNMQFAAGFDSPLELTVNDSFHVALSYTASNQTLVTAMTRNGAAFGPIHNVRLGTNFTDFRADHFAISSYSDAGQDPQFAGSILATGVVDNIAVTVPPPPVTGAVGRLSGPDWRVEFGARANWLYTLEQTEDFKVWRAVSPTTPGVEGMLSLADTNGLGVEGFYRVKAQKAGE
jgi:hypothetical protein